MAESEAEVMPDSSRQRNRVGRSTKYSESWFSVNKRIYIHERTLSELREIKVQQSLSSDDEVVEYLVTCHKYLCAIERMASPASKPQTAEYTNRLPPVNAICPHWSNLGAILAPCI